MKITGEITTENLIEFMRFMVSGDVPKTTIATAAAATDTTTTPSTAQIYEHGLTESQKEMYFYANIHHDRNNIAEWPLCLRKCESHAADTNRKQHVSGAAATIDNTIVISDSDSDCADDKTQIGKCNFCAFVHSFYVGSLKRILNSRPQKSMFTRCESYK